MFKAIGKANIILGIVLFLIAGTLFFRVQNDKKIEENNTNVISKVCLKNKCFDVEVANTKEEKEIGLMNKKNLDLNNGMLFVFEKEGVYNFWMKNTLIPLDIIWIDKNKKVVFIKENAQPCEAETCETFGSDKKAKYVLEVNEGMVKEMGVEVGDEAKFITLQTF